MRCLILILTVLLTAGAAHAVDTDAELSRLVEQLGDDDPRVREAATWALASRGEAAREALRVGTRSANLATSDASKSLLMRLPVWRADDPPEFIRVLKPYATVDPEVRVKVLQDLLSRSEPAAVDIMLRVIEDEESDDVLWRGMMRLNSHPSWKSALAKIDPQHARLPLVYWVLYKRTSENDPNAYQTLDILLEHILDVPESALSQIASAADKLATPGNHAAAASTLRLLRHYAEITQSSVPYWRRRILAIHANNGPLPGFEADLQACMATADPGNTPTLASIAERCGASIPARLLEDLAVSRAQDADEAKQRCQQLRAMAWIFEQFKFFPAARRGYELALAEADSGSYRSVAFALYLVARAQDDDLATAQALELALRSSEPDHSYSRQVNGVSESVTVAELWGEVDLHYFQAARAANDEAAMAKHARGIMLSPGARIEMFDGIFPVLQKCATTAEIDAMFDGMYARREASLKNSIAPARDRNDLAWFCAIRGRHLDDALRLATEAVAMDPNEPAYIDTLAEAHFRRGEVDEAIRLELRAIELKPDLPILKEQLARFQKGRATTQPSP
jgi:tetratricopeptide (TPR) repeat protein